MEDQEKLTTMLAVEAAKHLVKLSCGEEEATEGAACANDEFKNKKRLEKEAGTSEAETILTAVFPRRKEEEEEEEGEDAEEKRLRERKRFRLLSEIYKVTEPIGHGDGEKVARRPAKVRELI